MRPTEENLRKNEWRSYSERQTLESTINEELKEKQRRNSCLTALLRKLQSGQSEVLNKIITTNETWFYGYKIFISS